MSRRITSFSIGALLKKFVSLMWHEKQWMLTHSTNLLESLSSTTVICSVDRLGSIACVSGWVVHRGSDAFAHVCHHLPLALSFC